MKKPLTFIFLRLLWIKYVEFKMISKSAQLIGITLSFFTFLLYIYHASCHLSIVNSLLYYFELFLFVSSNPQ